MSGAPPSAPPLTPQPIGFISQQPQAQSYVAPPPYPTNPAYQLPYPPSSSLPYPPSSSAPYPPSSSAPYPSSSTSFPPADVQTTQPSEQTIVIQEPPQLGSDPVACHCPACKEFITTRVDYKTGTQTHLAALCLCCLLDDDCCCFLLPYCCNCTKDAHHYCPKCDHYFGKSTPI